MTPFSLRYLPLRGNMDLFHTCPNMKGEPVRFLSALLVLGVVTVGSVSAQKKTWVGKTILTKREVVFTDARDRLEMYRKKQPYRQE